MWRENSLPGEPAKRPYEIAMAMYRKAFYVRYGGDTIQLAPPFTSTPLSGSSTAVWT